MLSIRNPRVRELAQIVMQETGAPNITAAITQALEHEIDRTREAVPLRERVKALRRQALAQVVRPPAPITREEIDALWDP